MCSDYGHFFLGLCSMILTPCLRGHDLWSWEVAAKVQHRETEVTFLQEILISNLPDAWEHKVLYRDLGLLERGLKKWCYVY